MASKLKKIYGVADRAWQFVVGCDPSMLCAPRCWARRTVARIVECHKDVTPDRSKFYQIALTPDGQKWSGEAYLDEAHLDDPLHWRRQALIASGFHGDWARLSTDDVTKVMRVALSALRDGHRFIFLTKQPDRVFDHLENSMNRIFGLSWRPPGGLSIGCSVMNQAEADRCHDAMWRLAFRSWQTHVWYEPAIGPVDWSGWEFLKLIIVGGESGDKARPFDLQWARDTFSWCERNSVKRWMKQLGARSFDGTSTLLGLRKHDGDERLYLKLRRGDRKGEDWDNLPAGLRVRELPDELILRPCSYFFGGSPAGAPSRPSKISN